MEIKQLHPKYRPDIDGLRAIAVLAVVFFHAFPNLIKGGFIGVDIFFVISGFLISTIIFENLDNKFFSFVDFYSRRIKRIFPGLIAVLAACLIFGWFTLFSDEYKQLGKHIASGSIFYSNFVLRNEAGYFDNLSATKPLLHLWSLAIEEQFYIIWPLLLWFAFKRKFNLLTITVVIAIASFLLNLRGIKHDAVATFYSPQSRFWELLSGSLLAWVKLYKNNAFANIKSKIDAALSCIVFNEKQVAGGKTLSNILSFIGLLLLVWGFWRINKELNFPGKLAVVPVLGTVFIIAAGSKAWINRTILSNKVAIWFGLISFPLYLWHWPLFSFSHILGYDLSNYFVSVTIIILSIMLAWLTYFFIERPIRFGKQHRKKTIILTLLIILVGCLGKHIVEKEGVPQRAIAELSQDFDYTSVIPGYKHCEIKGLKESQLNLTYCSNKTSEENSAIIGDSHAEDKFHGLVMNDKKNSWMLIGSTSCPPVLGVSVEWNGLMGCEEKFQTILNYLIKSKSIKNVTLSFFGNYFKKDFYAADHKLNKELPKIYSSLITKGSREEIFFFGLDATIKLLIKNGKKVTIVVDIPELPFFPKDCIRNSLANCVIPKNEVLARQFELRNNIGKLKSMNPDLIVFDPINLFCDKSNCYFKNKDVIYYRDSHHLSQRGSNLYARYFLSLNK
ncbi:COG1835 Predicted acyltransferases [Candidatus Methylopumilus universalis]